MKLIEVKGINTNRDVDSFIIVKRSKYSSTLRYSNANSIDNALIKLNNRILIFNFNENKGYHETVDIEPPDFERQRKQYQALENAVNSESGAYVTIKSFRKKLIEAKFFKKDDILLITSSHKDSLEFLYTINDRKNIVIWETYKCVNKISKFEVPCYLDCLIPVSDTIDILE